MDEKEVRSRTITLGELWDIMNDFEIPFDRFAQDAMIAAAKRAEPTVIIKQGLFDRFVDTLRGLFPWM